MRRSDKEITNRLEIDRIIRDSDVCRLAFAVKNEPYLVPVSFGYDGEYLFIHTAKSGKKIDCIAANNRVCFEFERNVSLVHHAHEACKWSFAYECVIGFGAIRELTSDEQKIKGLNCIMEHYSGRKWEFGEAETKIVRVWEISISSLSGKRTIEQEA